MHTLLACRAWQVVPLREIIGQHFEGPELSSVRVSGPDLEIDASEAQPVAIIIHELSANAKAHGALAAIGGRVDVTWRASEQGAFEISWREKNGRLLPAPGRDGFGTTIVNALVEKQMRGSIERTWTRTAWR